MQLFYKKTSFAYIVCGSLLFVFGALILLITFQPSMGGGFSLGWGAGVIAGGLGIRRLEKQLEEKNRQDK